MIRLVLAAIVLLGSAVSSWADVIDFEIGSLFLNPGQTGSLEGFNFTNSAGASAFIVVPVTADSCTPLCVSNGTNAMGLFNDASVTLAPIVGGTFAASAFDVAGTFTDSTRNITSLEVIGNLFGGGQVTETFAVNPDAFQTFSLLPSFTNLTSLEFLGLLPAGDYSPEFQLDNIVVGSAVPEPGSVILLATLVVFLGSTLRRRLTA